MATAMSAKSFSATAGVASRPVARSVRPSARRVPVVCQAQRDSLVQGVAQKFASAGAAALLTLGGFSSFPAIASEFDILAEPTPTTTYFIDDAAVLSKSTRSDITKTLKLLEVETGYRLEVVTVRKLEFETDAFAFVDKALENWYPSPEAADKKGVLLVVTASKEGALTGGKSFNEAIGDDLVDSIISDNIPIFTEEEKYNQTVTSSLERIAAKLKGEPVPAAPLRNDSERVRTFKTKEETEKNKNVTSTVVVSLLVIAVVVPMLQYYGYTAKE